MKAGTNIKIQEIIMTEIIEDKTKEIIEDSLKETIEDSLKEIINGLKKPMHKNKEQNNCKRKQTATVHNTKTSPNK